MTQPSGRFVLPNAMTKQVTTYSNKIGAHSPFPVIFAAVNSCMLSSKLVESALFGAVPPLAEEVELNCVPPFTVCVLM